MRAATYLTVVLWLAASSFVRGGVQPQGAPDSSERFTVFFKGTPVGTEEVQIARSPDGVTITSSGRLGAPINLVNRRTEIRYDAQWRPLELTIDAAARGEPIGLRTIVRGTSAANEVTQGGKTQQKTDTIAADALLLPNNFFGPYEALASRVAGLAAGTTLKVYVPPQAEVPVQVLSVSDERIQTATRTIAARRCLLRFMNPMSALDAELWADQSGRLLRLHIPAASLDVLREDVATVTARILTVSHPGDQEVRVPAAGFTLAATLTRPPTVPPGSRARVPAVILVPGSGPQDRDETVAGIPIFGQIAGALADAGYLVIRYDKRGVGQSGGRPEAATLLDYAEDVRAVAKYLAKRADVDLKRIAVVGHSEGGWVGMLAASRDKAVAALVLVAAAGTTGGEVILEQQARALARMDITDEDRRARVELQKKIQAAVVSGTGWDDIPPELRRQADTPWFQSFLLFDPARVMPRVPQPILILQGELDRQVLAHHADRLGALAGERKRRPPVQVELFPGVNHLLVPAKTGEVDEYGTLSDRKVSPALTTAIVDWLGKTFATARR